MLFCTTHQGVCDRVSCSYAAPSCGLPSNPSTFVLQCTAALPEDKPRYVMGVGCVPFYCQMFPAYSCWHKPATCSDALMKSVA